MVPFPSSPSDNGQRLWSMLLSTTCGDVCNGDVCAGGSIRIVVIEEYHIRWVMSFTRQDEVTDILFFTTRFRQGGWRRHPAPPPTREVLRTSQSW